LFIVQFSKLVGTLKSFDFETIFCIVAAIDSSVPKTFTSSQKGKLFQV